MSLFSNTASRTVLALQGGGAHGAFTWGALDRLLETNINVTALSGVSSGAMIAAMAVQGFVHNGHRGARDTVNRLWSRVAEAHIFGNVSSSLDWMWGWDKGMELGNELAWAGIT